MYNINQIYKMIMNLWDNVSRMFIKLLLTQQLNFYRSLGTDWGSLITAVKVAAYIGYHLL